MTSYQPQRTRSELHYWLASCRGSRGVDGHHRRYSESGILPPLASPAPPDTSSALPPPDLFTAKWRARLISDSSLCIRRNMESIHGVDVSWLHHPHRNAKGT